MLDWTYAAGGDGAHPGAIIVDNAAVAFRCGGIAGGDIAGGSIAGGGIAGGGIVAITPPASKR